MSGMKALAGTVTPVMSWSWSTSVRLGRKRPA